jgi:hypothetical protein
MTAGKLLLQGITFATTLLCQGVFPQEVRAALGIYSTQSSIAVPGGVASAPINLRLRNLSAADEAVAIWQAGLSIVPETGAVGAVEIAAYVPPTDYIFAGISPIGPMQIAGSLPGAFITLTDAALESPSGRLIAGGDSTGLLELQLSISPGAMGAYRLLLQALSEDPFDSSSWGDPSFGLPIPFNNGQPDAAIEERTLLTILILPVPEPVSYLLGVHCLGGVLIVARFLKRRASVH